MSEASKTPTRAHPWQSAFREGVFPYRKGIREEIAAAIRAGADRGETD